MERLAGCRAFSRFRVDARDLLARALMVHLHLLKSSAGHFRRFGSVQDRLASHSVLPSEGRRRKNRAQLSLDLGCIWSA